MVRENIVKDYTSKNDKETIERTAARDQETPFGVVIGQLRDYYGIPKKDGWDTAMAICEHYGLD